VQSFSGAWHLNLLDQPEGTPPKLTFLVTGIHQ
jgi:hypothetical protein